MGIGKKISIAFKSFGTAHSFIGEHKLWKFIVIPGLLNVAIFYLSFSWFLSNVSDWVTSFLEFDCGDGSFSWICTSLSAITGLLSFFIRWILYGTFIGFYLYLYKNFILFIYSPVLAYLVEIVERKHKGIKEPFKLEQFLKETVRGIILAARGLLVEGLVVVVLFILAFIPIVNMVQPILLWLVSAYFLGVSMIDYSLERKGLNVSDSIIYNKRHKSLATGIGSVFQLVFLIPFVGWMIAPTYSVVAAYFAVEGLEKMID